ncbi:MAG: BamA/TamA family outer membrane protein [Zoogloeaceae bacterium]|jgi:translocation and assembly module TamA|nr:BamA/TamA family outer membrane protein [Zoogloeaceae bacterium]
MRPDCFLTSSLLCLLASLPVLAAPPRVLAPEPLDKLLQRYLHLEAPRDDVEREALQNRLSKEGGELLATEGYFEARLVLEGEALDALVLHVTPGPRARIESVRLIINGPVEAARLDALRADWPLKAGAPFRQEDWNHAKENLLLSLLERDFPTARLTYSEARVEADRHQVVLEVTAESGPPYRFGELAIEGLSRYSPELAQRYNTRAQPGEAYEESRLLNLQSALENTPYFASVFISLDTEAATAEADGSRTAPLRVRLREQSPHRLGLGAGVSSNTGARVEANFRTADLFYRAWQLNGGVRLEQLKQSAYADIFLPPTHDQYQYAFGVLTERSDIQDLRLQTQSLGFSRSRQRGSVDLTLALGYLSEKQTPQHQPSHRTRALTVNSLWGWHPFRNQTEGAGYASQIQIGGALKPVSDQNFVRLYGRHQQVWQWGARNTLNLRAEGGIVLADSRQGVPQSFLFRAGGSNSVRGYAYQSLGVQEGAATLGGRYLLTLSGETIHWLPDRPWGIAAFLDAGNAADDRDAFRLKTGYGLGARWKSPAGPLGMDLAYGDRWRLHFALSIPF